MRTLAELAPHLNLAGRRKNKGAGCWPPLVLLTDEDRLPDPLPIVARLPHGSLVILRHYGAQGRAFLAGRLAQLCRERRLTLLVAADFPLAAALRAGLHLPEGLVRGASPRIRLWHRRHGGWLTAAAHGRRALGLAAEIGADAALLSPVFATASHPDAHPLGALTFRRLVRRSPLPVYALGGIGPMTVRRLAGSGAAGVATVGGLSGRK